MSLTLTVTATVTVILTLTLIVTLTLILTRTRYRVMSVMPWLLASPYHGVRAWVNSKQLRRPIEVTAPNPNPNPDPYHHSSPHTRTLTITRGLILSVGIWEREKTPLDSVIEINRCAHVGVCVSRAVNEHI